MVEQINTTNYIKFEFLSGLFRVPGEGDKATWKA